MKGRYNGVLLHVSSLPSSYGIGSLGRDAFSFVDFLADAGVNYWQMLPVGVTTYGDSPYQSTSAFAGNPYFIDLDTLIADGLLKKDEIPLPPSCGIDYAWLFDTRINVLKKAYKRFSPCQDYDRFTCDNDDWLPDFALFSSLRAEFGYLPFSAWPKKYKYKNKISENEVKDRSDEINFHIFIQYEFDKQMRALANYAAKKGVKLIGDIPIYVAYDSADVWAHPELFKLDKNLSPTEVAGVPPDYFSATGQLWGNPLYNWPRHRDSGFSWWRARIARQLQYFDKIRIDHFRGFESYYKIPYGSKDATVGKWAKGVGLSVFDGFKAADGRIIAEDLGLITAAVRKMVKKSGFPGMKVFQFGFDGKPTNEHLPKNLKTENLVYYTGTHDNDTLRGWYEKLPESARAQVNSVIRVKDGDVYSAILAAVMKSRADLVIVPMQDYLTEGSCKRMNTPGTSSGNWLYTIPSGYVQSKKYVLKFTKIRKIKNV